jgi:hypothetical protein
MLGKLVIIAWILIDRTICDWVKLPEISNTPKGNYKIQSISSLKSSILGSSDVMSSVFSYDTPRVSSTTEKTLVTQASYIHRSNTKKFFPSTITSKTIEMKPLIVTDRFDHEELMMEPVKLLPKDITNRRTIFLNHTMPFQPHPTASTGKFLSSTQPEDDDDGVTIVSEEESLDSDADVESEEDYEFYYETETPEPPTTKSPKKASRKVPSKPQRRVTQVDSKKAKPQNHLSFSSFLKFLKNIQASFATRTAKNINDKINMLRKFRDKLLIAINSRIKSLWKTQPKTRNKEHKRTKRTLGGGGGDGWMSHGGGGMETYPSTEGALLSISFLTFAVFLIKLVLVSEQTNFYFEFS